MSGEIEVVDGVATQVAGDTVVVLWSAPASPERWRRLQRHCEQVAHESPFGMVCLDLILSTSAPPDSALRAEIQECIRGLGPKMRRLVVVPLGDSTWLSLVRTLVRAVLLVSGRSKQHTVVSTVAEGIEAVLEVKSPDTPSREQLTQISRGLFRALEVSTQQFRARYG